MQSALIKIIVNLLKQLALKSQNKHIFFIKKVDFFICLCYYDCAKMLIN